MRKEMDAAGLVATYDHQEARSMQYEGQHHDHRILKWAAAYAVNSLAAGLTSDWYARHSCSRQACLVR